jgi:transmembrane sensor
MSIDRLQDLLTAYADRRCTADEIAELNALLRDGWTRIRLGQQVPGIDWEKMYREILSGGRGEVLAPVRRLRKRWWYAAAAVLIFGMSTAVVVSLINNPKEKSLARVQNDVLPGGERAVLTLANGQQIILDNAQNGNVAQQGGTKIIKLNSGQLAYNAGNTLSSEILYNTISTPRGGQYQIVLPDGTKVWLNAASSIKFPTAFKGPAREVDMTGEVYMEVARNMKQPFIIRANGTEIKVLGTSFNINAYADEDAVKTTLIEGSVMVRRGAGESAILKPRQQAVVGSSDQQQKIQVQAADIDQTLAWKNGLFNFDGADLAVVLKQLSRWYDINIKYEGNVPVSHFKGELPRNLTLAQVTSILSQVEVKFRIEGRTLIVMP